MTTCFIGTSLHGNIISMSYSVPHIGISKNILKLDGYLKSWEKTCKNECIPIEKIYEEYTLINKCDKSKLKNNTIELKKLVYKNLKVIFGEENE